MTSAIRSPENRLANWNGTVHYADSDGRTACGLIGTHASWLRPTTATVTCQRCIARCGEDEPGHELEPAPADEHVARRAAERAARREARAEIPAGFYVADRFKRTFAEAAIGGPFNSWAEAEKDRRERNIADDCDVVYWPERRRRADEVELDRRRDAAALEAAYDRGEFCGDAVAAAVHSGRADRHYDAAERLRKIGLHDGAEAASRAARAEDEMADRLRGAS